MLSTEHGATPDIPIRPYARAKGNYTDDAGVEHVDDWRPPELPYVLTEEDRLPLEYNHGGCPAKGPRPVEDTCRAMERLIINGTSVRAARSLVGPHKQRWIEWEKHAAADKYPFNVFMRRIERARAHVEATCTTIIRSAAVHPDPMVAMKGAETTLKQQFPEEYAPKAAPAGASHVTNNVQVNVNGLDALRTMGPEQIRALGELFAGKTAPDPVTSDRWLAVPTADED
jgi:hypothetical protein